MSFSDSTSFVPSDIDVALAERQLMLERESLALMNENQLEFYTPHPKQCFFHENASFHYRYARTGNRFGKSEMGAAEDVAFALGYRPWLPIDHPDRTLGIPSHATKGLIVCTTWKKSREVFTELESGALGKLFKYIPKHALVDYTKNHSGFIDRITVRHVSGGNSVIFLDTIEGYKKNPLAQESSVHDWVHIDEPIPEGMWKAIARGLVDRGGRAWFTCTPLTEPWIDETFVPSIEDEGESLTVSDLENSRWMMKGSMTDNPHNKPEDIERFMSFLTEDEKLCRMHGHPTSMAGVVVKEFQWNEHVLVDPPAGWASWDKPPANMCIRFAIDYHFRKNDAVLFAATCPQGITYIWAELWQQMLLDEEVKAIKDVLGTHVPLPGDVDPLASTPNKMTETTAMDEYRRLGLPVNPATKDPVNGIRAMRALFKARDKHGRPVIFVNSACRRTLFEIARGFVWDGEENKPVKKNDDMMECLHRLALRGFDYIEPASDSDYAMPMGSEVADDYLTLPSGDNESALREKSKRAVQSKRYPGTKTEAQANTPVSFLLSRYGNN